MKKVYVFAAAAFCGLTMTTSCTKEGLTVLSSHALEIFAERSGTKTTVNGTTVKWVEGDKVWINNYEGTVTQNKNHWYVDGSFSTDNDFNMFYPDVLATATDAENQNEATATVVFPSRYVSSFDGDDQIISLPMGARSTGGAMGVMLKHLSAALNLAVSNITGTLLLVDSVSVTSADINLCGQASVTLSPDDVPVVSATGTGGQTVTVCFDNPVSIAVDGSKSIQVPVIPNTSGLGDLTVKVYTHQTLENLNILYLDYAKLKSDAPGLVRNAVASLPVEMTTAGTEITSHILGAFSVGNGKKIYFSPGNLQYKANEAYPWRFAPKQYNRMGADGSWNTKTWVDLFGWGTWTGSTPEPLRTVKDDSKYPWDDADFIMESGLADASQRNFDWRTPSSAEWTYIINTRPNSRFAKAVVHNNNGLIIFPDDFTMPEGVTLNAINQKKEDNFSTNILSNEEWYALEAAGCVFLPAAGCREVTGLKEVNQMGGYHSSTPHSASNDDKLRFADNNDGGIKNNDVNPAKDGGKRWGNSVRLVRNAN